MAKKFKFRLEAVLKYRQMVEDEQKRNFAAANAAVEEKRRQAEELDQERAAAVEGLRNVRDAGEVNMRALNDSLRYIGNLEMGAMSVRQEEERLRQQMEGIRQQFVAARRDKRAVEVLKEKRRAAYDFALGQEFQAQLDEISLRALLKRRREGH
ncbi:MAG: flagellar export protein FliJ [Planctomycetes bacterium]|nr:flagellar export protein FliJ [Planctomycetota bacterium]